MLSAAQYVYDSVSACVSGSGPENPDMSFATARYTSDRYKPSPRDVVVVQNILRGKSHLPQELIDAMIDYAEYWPRTTSLTPPGHIFVSHDQPNKLILRSLPLGYVPSEDRSEEYQIDPEYVKKYQSMIPQPWPEACNFPQNATLEVINRWSSKSRPRSMYPCRKIVFTIKSHDQGWGGEAGHSGTYKGSYTWFDVGLEIVSAFRESIQSEASKLAPRPQFPLSVYGEDDAQQNAWTGMRESVIRYGQWWRNESSQEAPQGMDNPLDMATKVPIATTPIPIVCSLRSILPPTVPKPTNGTGMNPGNIGSHGVNNSAENGADNAYMFSHDLLPNEIALQRNVTATRETREHKIEWSCLDDIKPDSLEGSALEKIGRGRESGSGEFVRQLQVGDVVTVWGKARFPGWVNHIEEMRMEIYWAV